MRRPCTFREADVARVLRAARKTGVEVMIEIDPSSGKLVVSTNKQTHDPNVAPDEGQ
jgi:hypothetical protein